MDTTWVETTVKRWQRDGTIDRVLSSKMVSSGDDNEGYICQIWFAEFEVILQSGTKTKKRFVVKRAESSALSREFDAQCGLFRREISTYSGLLRNMETLIEVHDDQKSRLWPRFYGSWKYFDLILEDLTAKNYRLMNRREQADLDLSLLILNSLGRYHAMGLVLLRQNAVQTDEFGPFLLAYEEVLHFFSLNSIKDLAEEILSNWGAEWKAIGRKIKTLIDEIPELVQDILNRNRSPFCVLNHGDLKATNIMLKRDYRGNPVNCKFLDFQLTNYSTFATDLYYFTVISVAPEIRRNHRDQLLKMYYDSLIDTLKFYEYPMTGIPAFSQMQEEMKRTSLLGFLFIPLGAALTFQVQTKLRMDATHSSAVDKANFSTDKFKDYFSQDIKNFIMEGYV